MTKIAIIGAGISGLTIAHMLRDVADIVVFEKSRGVGGRMATRYAEPYEFDHGAQFFTAKSLAFQEFLQPMLKHGVIAQWDARFVELEHHSANHVHQWDVAYPHYVGTPRMNSMAKYLAQDLTIHLNTRITQILDRHGWQVINDREENLGTYDWVISTAPPEQSAAVLPAVFSHASALRSKKMLACFSLMLGFEHALRLEWDVALIKGADISWISVNSSKPGRNSAFTLLVHSTNVWAEQHLDMDHEVAQEYLCKVTSDIIGHNVARASHIALHRWRYANTPNSSKPHNKTMMIDREHQLAACGDWLIQGRVEAAFSSAHALVNQLKAHIG